MATEDFSNSVDITWLRDQDRIMRLLPYIRRYKRIKMLKKLCSDSSGAASDETGVTCSAKQVLGKV